MTNKKEIQKSKRNDEKSSSGATGFEDDQLAELPESQAEEAVKPRNLSPLQLRPNKIRITIRFDPDLLEQFDAEALRAGASRATLLNTVIHRYLNSSHESHFTIGEG